MSLTSRLVKADVMAAFKKLSAVYSESRALMKMRETGIEIWLETLWRRHVTAAELEEAVRRYLGSDAQFWPKPGDLLKHAIAYREETRTAGRAVGDLGKAYEAWERRGWRNHNETAYEPCPVCDSTVEWRPLPIVRHDHQLHYEAGVRPPARALGRRHTNRGARSWRQLHAADAGSAWGTRGEAPRPPTPSAPHRIRFGSRAPTLRRPIDPLVERGSIGS